MSLPADVEAVCVEYVAREAMMLSGQCTSRVASVWYTS